MKLGRKKIQALQEDLNEVYDGYRNIIEGLNSIANSSHSNPDFALELTEKKNPQTLVLIRSQISKMENAMEELKEILGISTRNRLGGNKRDEPPEIPA